MNIKGKLQIFHFLQIGELNIQLLTELGFTGEKVWLRNRQHGNIWIKESVNLVAPLNMKKYNIVFEAIAGKGKKLSARCFRFQNLDFFYLMLLVVCLLLCQEAEATLLWTRSSSRRINAVFPFPSLAIWSHTTVTLRVTSVAIASSQLSALRCGKGQNPSYCSLVSMRFLQPITRS